MLKLKTFTKNCLLLVLSKQAFGAIRPPCHGSLPRHTQMREPVKTLRSNSTVNCFFLVQSTRGIHPPEAMMHSPCLRFHPCFRKIFCLHGKFPNFSFSRKI